VDGGRVAIARTCAGSTGVALIAHGDQVVYAKSYGIASYDHHQEHLDELREWLQQDG